MNYLDVLYTPLDIPARPDIDSDLFNEWAASVYPQKCIGVESKQKYVAHDRLKSDYPWNLAYGMHAGVWQNGFDTLFPHLAEYCYKGFGLELDHLYTVLFLPTRSHFIGKYFWHIDPDVSGLRFYLSNSDIEKNHLLMRKTTTMVENAWKMSSTELENILSNEIIKCRIKSSDQSFFLNNVYAAHTPVNTCETDRIAVFTTIKQRHLNEVMSKVIDPLVVKSANKYIQYSIFRN